MDLDITHYNYDDLLNLFKLSYDFGEEDLKRAKKIVLKMHPDKSKLGPEYFMFFSKAYKTLYSVYEFKNKTAKSEKPEQVPEYKEYIQIVTKKGDDNSQLLKKFIQESECSDPKSFNKWFNAQYEKINELDREKDGHGSWLKSNEDVSDTINATKETMGQEFSKRKKELKSLIKYEGVKDIHAYNLGGAVLHGEESESNYTSDMFGTLAYQDLRQAHTETVIAVDEDDFDSIRQFKSVNEYQRHRDGQQLKPLSEAQATKFLSDSEKIKEEEATKRAFFYAQEVEKSKQKTNQFWSGLKQIHF